MNVKCPTCRNQYEYTTEKDGKLPDFFPFCSKRCQLIDLGAWLDSEYKIESQNDQDQDHPDRQQ